MESQRSLIIIGLLLVSFLLWIEYQEYIAPKPVVVEQSVQDTTPKAVPSVGVADTSLPQVTNDTVANTSSVANDLPSAPTAEIVQPEMDTSSGRFISVLTDTLDVTIDLVGGDVVKADLVKYPVTLGATDSYKLLKPNNASLHIAQSGLVGKDGPDASADGRPFYSVQQTEFVMDSNTLIVPLTWRNAEGLSVTKTFSFEQGTHLINVDYQITNNSDNNLQMVQFAQLKQTTADQSDGNMFMPIYRGGAYSTQDTKYEKFNFGDFEDDKLNLATVGGWTGMIEHYFVSAWVPPQEETNRIYSRLTDNGQNAIIGYTGETIIVPSNGNASVASQLYAGPKDQAKLAAIARGLDLTVDYGILFWLSQPLFSLLKFLHSLVGNWGVAIILITIIVKGAMYWLTKKQYESMAKMRNLAPKMQQLKERYGDDRQKMSQAMMEMYKKEKVNPMGGCFPLLLQMPIFLALYWVLLESVELRHADFILWINDLSVADPYYVLPILTGASMYLLQKLQPMTITDPMQQKIMQFMPVAMSVFFFFFPAGLVLYWLISNVITLIQAKIIYASMEKRGISAKG
jgi:YidC/Oxa1 family membrane protein insertase